MRFYQHLEKLWWCSLKILRTQFIYIFITWLFLWKKSWIGMKYIFSWILKIKLNTDCEKKKFSVFEGFKGGPYKHTKTFFRQIFKFFICSQHSWKKHFISPQVFFPQKYACNKKKLWTQDLHTATLQQSFAQYLLKWTILAGSLIQKPT